MSYDGLTMAAVVKELQETLIGSRIEKIYQPLAKEITLVIHKDRAKLRLLLSADARDARVHLTAGSKENPTAPPLFCMVMRKHLEGGRIVGFFQEGLERVLEIRIEAIDELGMLSEKSLICEVMGKHSNIILVDPASGVILDGITRYSYATSRHREVLPGRRYVPPPEPEGINPLQADEEGFRKALWDPDLDFPLEKLLVRKLAGFGPQICRELAREAGLDPGQSNQSLGERELNLLWTSVKAIRDSLQSGRYLPAYARSAQAGAIEQSGSVGPALVGLGSVNEILDEYYRTLEKNALFRQKADRMLKVLRAEIKKAGKKASVHEETLQKAEDAETLRIFGELITANIYRLPPGVEKFEAENYYDPSGGKVMIEMDAHRTPAENAQAYFKRYNKARAGRNASAAHLLAAREELGYLESVRTAIEQAVRLADLAEIGAELVREGYLQPEKTSKKGPAPAAGAPEPLSVRTPEGYEILVGRNNRQNDYLSMKLARPEDLWLHAKDIPGSHVVIRHQDSRPVPPRVLEAAAGLAAYYSQARESGKVPVDYTLRKHVRKPKGARPGMVLYDHQQTVMVEPSLDLNP